jgi:apolipoprotein N-acyltransferase
LVFGTITGGAGTIWFWDTLPLDFLGIQNQAVQVTAIGMTWGYVAASLGLPISLASLLLWRLRESNLFPLIAAIVWTIAEIGRMWAFAITTWAPTSLLGPHFSAASIGYPLTENHLLLQLADPFGIHALNLVASFAAGLLASLASATPEHRVTRPWMAQLTLGAAICSLPYASISTPEEPKDQRSLRIAIITEHLEDVRDFNTHASVAAELAAAAAVQPPVDVILLPEEFSLTPIFWSRDEANKFLAEHFGTRDVLILNTRNNRYPAEEDNTELEQKKLVYDTTSGKELGRYIKQNLMPLGEYAPAFTKTFFSVIPDSELQLYIDGVDTFPEANFRKEVFAANYRGFTIGGLLCSDLLSPELYRSLVHDHHADILVNLANQFWFHGSKTLYSKTVQMARVHAAQNRRPLLMANNTAPSFAMDSNGTIIASSKWGDRGVLVVEAP